MTNDNLKISEKMKKKKPEMRALEQESERNGSRARLERSIVAITLVY